MNFLNHPVFWREKKLATGAGMMSFWALLMQIAPSYSITKASAGNIKDFLVVFSVCWFTFVTFGQISNLKIDDIESVAATPLGIKGFLKGRSFFSLLKFSLYTILIMSFLYYNRFDAIRKLRPPSIILFLFIPYLIYHWALFLNMLGLLVPDRFITFTVLILIAPSLFISTFSGIMLEGQVKNIVQMSAVPIMGVLALIANKLMSKFVPKEAIRDRCLRG
ncbi:MAG: hypothetical protein LBB34_02820 [Holosporales bacterium]|jgi:hypothetical protein|nr:hypothetical protein [Holosporales bacterium]